MRPLTLALTLAVVALAAPLWAQCPGGCCPVASCPACVSCPGGFRLLPTAPLPSPTYFTPPVTYVQTVYEAPIYTGPVFTPVRFGGFRSFGGSCSGGRCR